MAITGNIGKIITEDDRSFALETLDRILRKMPGVARRNENKIPYTTGPDGRYDDRSDMTKFDDWGLGLSWWTNGFWGGILWQLYSATGDEQYRRIACISEEKMDACFEQFSGLHHDVGFMWLPTAAANYRMTGNERSRIRALHAANLLAGRYNPAGRYIRAWNEVGDSDTRGWAIIDCMMNLNLLYWASEQTGDPRYIAVAISHADTVRKSFIRPDGSSNHIVEFDPDSGSVVKTYGGQGYADGTAWTRGQAWAIYGFALSFLHTGNDAYLETSMRVADYFLAHMREDGIIPVDFLQPAEPDLEDSCGAVTAASGLIELADILAGRKDPGAARYLDAAIRILRTITDKRSIFDDSCDAIVQNCTGAYHSNDHHITMVYADYYYIEAILKLCGKGFRIW